MQKMPPAIFTGTVFGLLQSFGLHSLYTGVHWGNHRARVLVTKGAFTLGRAGPHCRALTAGPHQMFTHE